MLIDVLLRDDTLLTAWQRVWENAGMAGVDGMSVKAFNVDVINRIGRLRTQLRERRYTPGPLLQVVLPRPGKTPRLLAVPSVRDRLLQTAAALVLTPLLEPHFEQDSYGYRPRRSVAQAIARVIAGREAGFRYVVDADIHAYFDHIPRHQVLDQLRPYLPDESLLPLIRLWLEAPIQTRRGLEYPQVGIAQGSPLSPLLANLYLDPFDEAMARDDRWLVRYADDFVILCRDNDSAERTLEEAGNWLSAAQLEFNFDKTRIVTFDMGFTFLGVRFQDQRQWAENPNAAPWLFPRGLLRQAMQETVTQRQPKPVLADDDEARQTQAVAPLLPPLPMDDEPPQLTGLDEIRDETTAPPLLRTLYLTEPGAYVHREGGRLLVHRGDEELSSLPIEKIDQVLVDCEGAISFGALRHLLQRQVAVVVLDRPGEPMGAFTDLAGGHTELHRAQFLRAEDPTFCLATARALVAGKIANTRLLLRRYLRFRPELNQDWDNTLKTAQRNVLSATDLDSVRGHEGAAARAWFDGLAQILGETWDFSGRNRQPPKDPVNALLSYGYAILFHSVWTLVLRRGLNPWVGSLHANRAGHPALISDLMEEFRSLIVDATMIRFLLHSDVHPKDFRSQASAEDGHTSDTTQGYRLPRDLRRRFVHSLEQKLNSAIQHPATGEQLDWRRAIQYQVSHWAEVVAGHAPAYRPWMPR